MTPLDALILFITGALCVIALIACMNVLTFPRLKPHPPTPLLGEGARANVRGLGRAAGGGGRFVSILIPARDEAAVIADTVRAMLAQTYTNFELIILDDNSTDGTGEIARHAANEDARLRIIAGTPLPAGWLGKNWACQQLGAAASPPLHNVERGLGGEVNQGENQTCPSLSHILGSGSGGGVTDPILIFCDADVTWTPDALAALVAELERKDGAGQTPDMLTVWSTQTTVTWSERLVVPLMALVILGYLPAPLVHYTPFAAFAAANGQCLAFRRRVYEAIGGHAAVKSSIIEDIGLARLVKRCGWRLRMADGAGVIGCRMYRDWAGVRAGYAKNIIAGYGSIGALAAATIFHYAIFFVPFVWIVFGWDAPGWNAALPLAWIVLGIGARALTAAVTRQRIVDALLMPLSVLLMTIIAAQAVYWRVRYGGARWKGRTIMRATPSV